MPGKFLHNFLVTGPFPNPLPKGVTEYFHTDDACPGFSKDYLVDAGGEKGIRPYEGLEIKYDQGKSLVWQSCSLPVPAVIPSGFNRFQRTHVMHKDRSRIMKKGSLTDL